MQTLTLKTDTINDWTRLNDRASSIIAITRTLNEEYGLAERDLRVELGKLTNDSADIDDVLIPFQTLMTLAINVAFRFGTLHPGYFMSQRQITPEQRFLYAFYSRAPHMVEAAEPYAHGFRDSLTDKQLKDACELLMDSGDIEQTGKALGIRYATLRTRLRKAFSAFLSTPEVRTNA